jgi:hypothetical protein
MVQKLLMLIRDDHPEHSRLDVLRITPENLLRYSQQLLKAPPTSKEPQQLHLSSFEALNLPCGIQAGTPKSVEKITPQYQNT